MNRILFEKDEIVDGVAIFGGARAEHVLNVLHGEVGQVLKTGEIDGPIGTSEIVGICGTGILPVQSKSEATAPGRTGETPVPQDGRGELRVTVRCRHDAESIRPWVDLILAPPRPRVMKRLLPQLATLGVGRIFLVGAKKVEKDFWGATLLQEENYRPLLIDGLMQAGASILPVVETRRNFRKFVKEEVDEIWPEAKRIVAHPYGTGEDFRRETGDLRGLETLDGRRGLKSKVSSPCPGLLLAVGPEGGWTDEEVALLEERGFSRYSLGSRILRTDTATIALLAQLMKEFDKC